MQYEQMETRLHASYEKTAEKYRPVLDNIDARSDVEHFVLANRTGWARPGPTIYEDYYTGAPHSHAKYAGRSVADAKIFRDAGTEGLVQVCKRRRCLASRSSCIWTLQGGRSRWSWLSVPPTSTPWYVAGPSS